MRAYLFLLTQLAYSWLFFPCNALVHLVLDNLASQSQPGWCMIWFYKKNCDFMNQLTTPSKDQLTTMHPSSLAAMQMVNQDSYRVSSTWLFKPILTWPSTKRKLSPNKNIQCTRSSLFDNQISFNHSTTFSPNFGTMSSFGTILTCP